MALADDGTDVDIATRVAERDESALELAFSQYSGAVMSVARRVLRNEVLAEDVVQDTFVTFWNAPERYKPERGTLRTFLVTIAHRRAVDAVRSETARARREERPPDPVHIDVEEEALTRTLSSAVREALGELSKGERDAITMAYFGGLSYVEVAQRLGAPEGTVKSRIRNGMKKLSIALADVAR